MTPKDKLHDAVTDYMQSVLREYDDYEHYHMSAGVEAFIHTNYTKEPYYPVDMFPVEEVTKKWWEFWK